MDIGGVWLYCVTAVVYRELHCVVLCDSRRTEKPEGFPLTAGRDTCVGGGQNASPNHPNTYSSVQEFLFVYMQST